jgi:hypothetical protein
LRLFLFIIFLLDRSGDDTSFSALFARRLDRGGTRGSAFQVFSLVGCLGSVSSVSDLSLDVELLMNAVLQFGGIGSRRGGLLVRVEILKISFVRCLVS